MGEQSSGIGQGSRYVVVRPAAETNQVTETATPQPAVAPTTPPPAATPANEDQFTPAARALTLPVINPIPPIHVVPIPPIAVPTAGFVPPRCSMEFSNVQGRPVTSEDVVIRKGFDDLSPGEAAARVRSGLKTPLHESNQALVERHATATHKALSIAINNAFFDGSPSARFARQNPDARFSIVGTMSAIHPTLVCLERTGQAPAYYSRGPAGYELLSPMKYPVVMKAEIRLAPQGVRVTYPEWSSPVLSRQTTFIQEM